LTAIGIVLVLTSCATAPVSPSIDVPGGFSAAGEANAPDRWWEAFEDDELNRLIERGVTDNLDIRMAWDRLDQAAALTKMAGAPLWPDVNAALGVSDIDSSGTSNPFTIDGSSYTASLTAAYEIDIWGRIRSGRDAARADMRASSEDLDAIAITVSAEIAGAWYELQEHRSHLDILLEQVEVNETFLELLEIRFNQGLAGAVDVLQQRQQLAATQGEIPLVEARIEVFEHEIAVLLGDSPRSGVAAGGTGLPELPLLPDTGLAADLMLRRPDVRAAKLRVEAADERVAAAIAERFPKLSISISAQDTEREFRSLFDNWVLNLAANLTAPIFDGRRRRSEVERSGAVANERLHDFEKKVLIALKDVENALVLERRQAEFAASVDDQVGLARQTVEFTKHRYINGDTDYLPVLIALRTSQALERRQLEAEGRVVRSRIDLYRALAGAWPEPEIDEDEETAKNRTEKLRGM
jgi:NodT family efflux transporter outer membrane factor (OMF) lipoprotein